VVEREKGQKGSPNAERKERKKGGGKKKRQGVGDIGHPFLLKVYIRICQRRGKKKKIESRAKEGEGRGGERGGRTRLRTPSHLIFPSIKTTL